MVIKVYISGISGNKEVKKRQQRVLLILDSKNVRYEVIDIAEPGAEECKDFMQNNSTSLGGTISDPSPRHPLPPQIFNDEDYCGDYDLFDMANEIDEMEKFLKLEGADLPTSNAEIKLRNGEVAPEEEVTKENEKEVIEESEKEVIDESEKEVIEENEKKENEAPNEEEKVESEEKSTEEEVKESKDSIETESVENTKEIEEPTEVEEPKGKERKESAASEGETKEENATGAGDEYEEKEKDEGESSKTDDEKAEKE